jgi:hypothetical protein
LPTGGRTRYPGVALAAGAAEAPLSFAALADVLGGSLELVMGDIPPPQGRAFAVATRCARDRVAARERTGAAGNLYAALTRRAAVTQP